MSEVDRKVAFTFTPSMWTGVRACQNVWMSRCLVLREVLLRMDVLLQVCGGCALCILVAPGNSGARQRV